MSTTIKKSFIVSVRAGVSPAPSALASDVRQDDTYRTQLAAMVVLMPALAPPSRRADERLVASRGSARSAPPPADADERGAAGRRSGRRPVRECAADRPGKPAGSAPASVDGASDVDFSGCRASPIATFAFSAHVGRPRSLRIRCRRVSSLRRRAQAEKDATKDVRPSLKSAKDPAWTGHGTLFSGRTSR